MNRKYYWLTVFLCAWLVGCQNGERSAEAAAASPTGSDLTKTLPGTWQAVSLTVQINTYDNTDTSFVFELREENWEERLGVKPRKTFFQLDNRYRTEFRTVLDSLVEVQRGVWNVFGDTLMLIEPDNTTQYEVTLRSGLADFRTLIDWDGDGQADDELLEVHRFIGKGTE